MLALNDYLFTTSYLLHKIIQTITYLQPSALTSNNSKMAHNCYFLSTNDWLVSDRWSLLDLITLLLLIAYCEMNG